MELIITIIYSLSVQWNRFLQSLTITQNALQAQIIIIGGNVPATYLNLFIEIVIFILK